MLCCPKCRGDLTRKGQSYFCENGHCYDISAKGYVNLLLANQKHSSNPGDDAQSLLCRDSFLLKGYYQNLSQAITDMFNKYLSAGCTILDAGCGTGYYLRYLIQNSKQQYKYLATDISKKGVSMTASKCPQADCFVSSVFNLPLTDSSLEGVMSVFCPYSSAEFARVIKDNGCLIAVTPGEKHLYQLKEVVYANPYYNEESGYKLSDFDLVEQINVTYMMDLTAKADIEALWKMMPYYHTSSRQDSQKLFDKEQIETTADFLLQVFRRKKR
ncbi:MAG: methyltransferase domain-containing protein [Erysipelotrichia bacterium]|nr:methyltransferase domain-containing protein [Erysipelotrichia bacterium]